MSTHDGQYSGSVLEMLKPHAAFNAEYNSQERQDQHASICEPGTRERVIKDISEWAMDDHAQPICWLHGPAGTGKSSIASTIAKEFLDKQSVVLTFFSRGRTDCNALTKLFATLAYQLAAYKALPSAQQSIGKAIQSDPRVLAANFETQFHKLVVDPIMAVMAGPPSMPKIPIIIDGLDECDSDTHQTQLIKLLVKTAPALFPHACFLVTSRSEE